MNKKLITDKFCQTNKQIFPFAYSLIFDELQAQQLIIDSISIFIGRDTQRLEDYCDENDMQSQRRKWFEIEKIIYKNVFQIGKKRFDQVRASLSFDEENAQFYALSLMQRAVLFLRHQTDFDESDIIEILNVDYIDYRQLQATSEMNISKNYNGEVLI